MLNHVAKKIPGVRHLLPTNAIIAAGESNDLFSKAFDLAIEVSYSADWENSTGYLDNATDWKPTKKEMEKGSVFRSVDPTGRRILLLPIMGGDAGTMVVFDRYTPGHGPQIFASNYPDSVKGFLMGFTDGHLDEEKLQYILGHVFVKDGKVKTMSAIPDRFETVLASI